MYAEDALGSEQLSPPSSSSRTASERKMPSQDGNFTVYVYGLTNKVDDRHLDEIFGAYGRIARLRVRRGMLLMAYVDCIRRSAILEYDRTEDAEMAVQHMDHGQIDGVYIRALLYEDRKLEDDRQPRDGRRRDSYPRSSSPSESLHKSHGRKDTSPSRSVRNVPREQSSEPY